MEIKGAFGSVKGLWFLRGDKEGWEIIQGLGVWSDVVRWARLIARFTPENGVRRDMVRGYYEFLKIKSSDLSSIRNWGICSGTYF